MNVCVLSSPCKGCHGDKAQSITPIIQGDPPGEIRRWTGYLHHVFRPWAPANQRAREKRQRRSFPSVESNLQGGQWADLWLDIFVKERSEGGVVGGHG